MSAQIGQVLDKSTGAQRSLAPPKPGDILGLYFSAHWCPPCRGFTPQLVTFYNRFKASERGSRLEIVFVSLDSDEPSFKQYHSEMAWPALPFADNDLKGKLSKRYKIRGIPSLIFIDAVTGKLVNSNGRQCVTEDPDGVNFPWALVPLSQLITSRHLVNKDGHEVDARQVLDGKVVGLYFSASWCSACQMFTPELVKTYQKLKHAGRKFEIIFVSADQSEDDYHNYMSHMPWLAVPFDDGLITKLSERLEVHSLPTLILLDENFEVISTDGISVITKDKDGQHYPWPQPPLEQLTRSSSGVLNESACFVIFTEGRKELIAQAVSMVTPIATNYVQHVKTTRESENPVPELRFFYEGEEKMVADQLRSFVRNSESLGAPRVTIINVPDQQFFTLDWGMDGEDPATLHGLQQLVDSFKNGQVDFKPLASSAD